METAKRKYRNKGMRLLKVRDGKYFIKVPNLDIPIEINKYLFERWSKLSGLRELKTV
jgi:hypothetical protein